MNSELRTQNSDIILISNSAEDTQIIGKIIGEYLRGGDVVALIGELGSGKTCITRGIARGVGVSEKYQITSPTFTLINEYPGRATLYHLDIYRLSGLQDLEDMGYEEYFYGDGIIVIEWAEKIKEILPSECFNIYLRYLDENKRELKISGRRDTIEKISEKLKRGGFR
ncbi:MAG: tRNA (adenosine(37)-N6)-threonylcarbamoyltransferase complex ATPase subunit type 1 TsaE [Syntrophales bacterium]|nr:tRNA (adenosine(37)-N6)-threonylcarbamoyltransferase complex ATPase subunit type 1 TsaE [Syntrophales bacterium]